jgi:hypothetical protein
LDPVDVEWRERALTASARHGPTFLARELYLQLARDAENHIELCRLEDEVLLH